MLLSSKLILMGGMLHSGESLLSGHHIYIYIYVSCFVGRYCYLHGIYVFCFMLAHAHRNAEGAKWTSSAVRVLRLKESERQIFAGVFRPPRSLNG